MSEPVKMLIVRFMLEHPAELAEAYRIAHPMPPSPPRGGLTLRQREVLDFIESYSAEHRTTPSFDEMREAVGLKSKSGIARIVDALEERGFIAKRPRHRARALVLAERQA